MRVVNRHIPYSNNEVIYHTHGLTYCIHLLHSGPLDAVLLFFFFLGIYYSFFISIIPFMSIEYRKISLHINDQFFEYLKIDFSKYRGKTEIFLDLQRSIFYIHNSISFFFLLLFFLYPKSRIINAHNSIYGYFLIGIRKSNIMFFFFLYQ